MSEIRNPTVWNPETNCIYVDDPYQHEPTYETVLMNVGAFMSALGGASKAASTVSLERIFYNNGPAQHNYLDLANEYYDRIVRSRAASTPSQQIEKAKSLIKDKKFAEFQQNLNIAQVIHIAEMQRIHGSKAGAIITSLDYPGFVTNEVVGTSPNTRIRTGILASLFQTIPLAQLTGQWQSFDDDLKYYRNLSETKSPEPSKGTGALKSVEVEKHGGAVAITQRAEMVINGYNPFATLVGRMGQKRLFDENDYIADVIQANTANTIAGVDFGARTGSPPASTTIPTDFITSLINTFEALPQDIDLFISRGTAYMEYVTNDIVRGGVNNPPPTQTNVNEQVGPFPLMGGVTWARDNAITSNTNGWAMNNNAIKLFRGPSRNYTIANEDTETTKYVTKNYFKPDTMEANLIYMVTNITA